VLCTGVLLSFKVLASDVENTKAKVEQHQAILDELVRARLAENAAEKAAKAARYQVCRDLVEEGKIELRDCPPLE